MVELARGADGRFGLAFGGDQRLGIPSTQGSEGCSAESLDEFAACEIGSLHEKGVRR
jgi:hypothetical protein